MARKIIPIGTVFGKLTVIGDIDVDRGPSKSACMCECGNELQVKNNNLLSGGSTQCRQCSVISCGMKNRTHGCTSGTGMTPEYRAWLHMKDRCREGHRDARNYFDRGIAICREWVDSFEVFLADMGLRPTSKHSIERCDNNAGYSKSNCEWALRSVQNRNQRRNRMMTFYGKTMCMTDWSAISGVSLQTISTRLRSGLGDKESVWTPPKRSKRVLKCQAK